MANKTFYFNSYAVVNNEGNVTVDLYNPEANNIISELIEAPVAPVNLKIKNFKFINTELLKVLSKLFRIGTNITVVTKEGEFTLNNSNPKVRVNSENRAISWDEGDFEELLAQLPAEYKKLRTCLTSRFEGRDGEVAEFKTPVDVETAIRRTRGKFIPWKELIAHNEQRQADFFKYLKVDFEVYNKFKKDLYKNGKAVGTRVEIDPKNYIEAEGEITFARETADIVSEAILSDAERAFLYANARFYGVDIPKFYTRTESVKTSKGWAQFPERTLCGMSASDWDKVKFDPRQIKNEVNLNLPGFVRAGRVIKEDVDHAGEKQAYDNLMWFINNGGDEWLVPPYVRCPVCGEIYNSEGTCKKCGHTECCR